MLLSYLSDVDAGNSVAVSCIGFFLARLETSWLCLCSFTCSITSLTGERGTMNSSFGGRMVFMLPCTSYGVASSVSLGLVSYLLLVIKILVK